MRMIRSTCPLLLLATALVLVVWVGPATGRAAGSDKESAVSWVDSDHPFGTNLDWIEIGEWEPDPPLPHGGEKQVRIEGEVISRYVCRGQYLYFKLVIINETCQNISGTLILSFYDGYGCHGNPVRNFPRQLSFQCGRTVHYYYLRAVRAVAPGEYSIKIHGNLGGQNVSTGAMNFDVYDCNRWRVGGQHQWGEPEAERSHSEMGLPLAPELYQNYPNPFNAVTQIGFSLTNPGHVSLEVYDIGGRLVGTLVSEYREPGRYLATWNASQVSSGVYFCKLTCGDYSSTKKMNLLK